MIVIVDHGLIEEVRGASSLTWCTTVTGINIGADEEVKIVVHNLCDGTRATLVNNLDVERSLELKRKILVLEEITGLACGFAFIETKNLVRTEGLVIKNLEFARINWMSWRVDCCGVKQLESINGKKLDTVDLSILNDTDTESHPTSIVNIGVCTTADVTLNPESLKGNLVTQSLIRSRTTINVVDDAGRTTRDNTTKKRPEITCILNKNGTAFVDFSNSCKVFMRMKVLVLLGAIKTGGE